MSEKTIEQMKDYIIHHSVALNRTFTREGMKKAGQLIAHTGAVYFIEENSEAKSYICSFEVSDDMTKIECNRLAKNFVNAYSLEQLQEEYLTALRQKAEAEQAFNKKADADMQALTELSKKIPFDFSNNGITVDISGAKMHYSNGKKIDFATRDRWNYNGYSIDFEVRIVADNMYSVNLKASINSICGYTHIENNTYSEAELLTYLNQWAEIEAEQKRIIADHVEDDKRKMQAKINTMDFIDNILDNGKMLIIKTKKSATAFFGGNGRYSKFSCKGEGKYRRSNYEDIMEYISKSTEYAAMTDDEYHNTKLQDIVFIAIPNFETVNT